MADVLSALPNEGGARVGWTPVPGTTEYEVRHSLTGAGVWTTVTDITTNYTTLTGLDYTEVYDVQRRSTDGIDTSWSASVTVQPWIVPADEFGTLFRNEGSTGPGDFGSLTALENNSWALVITFERVKLGLVGASVQSLFGVQANGGSADGLAGILCWLDTSNNLNVRATVGSSATGTATTSTTFGLGRHTIFAYKSGTTLEILDESGGSIGTATLSSATMDWTTSTTKRTTLNGNWATTVSPNLTNRHIGNVPDFVYVSGGVTNDERDALLRLHREKYLEANPTARHELLLDSEHIDTNTVGTPAVLALTKQGEILLSEPDGSHRSGLGYVDVHRLPDGRWRMWVAAYQYVSSVFDRYGLLRMDSKDGLAWVEPDLGIIGSTGLLLDRADTLPLQAHNTVRTEVAGEEYLYGLEVDIPASFTGAQIYAATDENTAPTLLTSADVGAFYNEGKFLVFRDSDGRPIFYYNYGHATDDRTIAKAIHTAGGQGAAETFNVFNDCGDVTAFQAPNAQNQFYALAVSKIANDLWLMFVTLYNATTEQLDIDLYISRDEGLTATQIEGSWLPLGAGGQWDSESLNVGALVRIGDVWRFYYKGHDQDHAAGSQGSSIGYATLTYGRLAELVA